MSRREADAETLAEGVLAGEKRAIARAISLVEDRDPVASDLVRRLFPHTGRRRAGRADRAAGRRQVEPDRVARRAPARDRSDGRGRVRRSLEPVHAGRGAGRPHPADRPLPRPRRVHPVDEHPRLPGRRQRGDAAGAAGAGRGRQGRAAAGDGRRRSERGRGRVRRRHRGARAAARVGRLDPGAEGGRDGDPRRDRHQQGRPPGDADDALGDPLDPVARRAARVEAADRRDRGDQRRGRRRPVGRRDPPPRAPGRQAGWPSGGGAASSTRSSPSPCRRCGGGCSRRSSATTRSSACWTTSTSGGSTR